ncbi:DUF1501 domain-containing protein [Thaumasiovibrio sp. DFM-14]|uniref:DUF1501 domain-containing protein n=1 Tax=Thaumasiovibrio sp. DFM-14 TaxID=3384792 RepID=UPI0039A0D165
MKLSRRRFLQSGAAVWSSSALPLYIGLPKAAFAAGDTSHKALVCVYLGGGCDSFNMVLPMSGTHYDEYQLARPDIAHDSSVMLDIALTSDNGVPLALNPNMPRMAQQIQNGRAVPIINVGALIEPITQANIDSAIKPSHIGSHSNQYRYWHRSFQPEKGELAQSGWGGMAIDILQDPFAILPQAMTTGGSIWTAGDQVQDLSLKSDELKGFKALDGSAQFRTIYEQYLKSVPSSASMLELSARYQQAIETPDKLTDVLNRYPEDLTITGSRAANNFRMVKRMLQAAHDLGHQRQIFYIQVGGWDNHATTNDNKLATLDQLLGTFQTALDSAGLSDSVVTFTMSEFGRTIRNNSKHGTDHGWGSNQLVLGPVNGGRAYGTYPSFKPGGVDDWKNKFIPSTPQAQMAATLMQWLGLTNSSLDHLFPILDPTRDAPFNHRTLAFLGPNSYTVLASEDSWIRGGTYADTNLNNQDLEVRGGRDNSIRYTLLKFDLSIPPSSQATLRLYISWCGATPTREIAACLTDDTAWSQGSVTWNTAPKMVRQGNSQVITPEQTGHWVEFDVSNLLIGQQGTVTLLLKQIDAYERYSAVRFSDIESGKGPELILA